MSISNWPEEERPRERLLQLGSEALTDAQLLAILFQHGTRGKSALDLAREVLTHFSGWRGLLQSDQQTLCQFQGIGPVKYCQLQAALEISRRCLQERLKRDDPFNTSLQAQQFIISSLRHHQHEVFAALFLDNQHRMIQFERLFHGTINTATIYPREVIKRALHHNAAALIIAHNHPSGHAEPSQSDQDLTNILKKALELVDIKLLDHIVVGDNQAISMSERGWC